MTLWEYIQQHNDNGCFTMDTCDVSYDVIVTVDVDINDEQQDYYDKFVFKILNSVEVVDGGKGIMNWEGFVKSYWDALKKFETLFWVNTYEDDDDFIYEWIHEIHMFLAGYTSETMYEEFCNRVLGVD